MPQEMCVLARHAAQATPRQHITGQLDSAVPSGGSRPGAAGLPVDDEMVAGVVRVGKDGVDASADGGPRHVVSTGTSRTGG